LEPDRLVAVLEQETLPSGRKATVASLARLVPGRCWAARSCGRGCQGHRDYQWALAATRSSRHWVLIRRSISDPADLAFFYCHAPGAVSVSLLISVAGKRWQWRNGRHQQGKGQVGLGQHQVRLWHSFHRHTVLSMCALALLAIAAARPQPAAQAAGGSPGTAARNGQPHAWRDTGILPATADVQGTVECLRLSDTLRQKKAPGGAAHRCTRCHCSSRFPQG